MRGGCFGAPEGESYRLTIDATPALSGLADKQVQFEIPSLTYQLTDNGDGTWGVTEDQELAWSFTVPGLFEQTGSAKSQSSGIWDENLKGFVEQKGVMTDYVVDNVNYVPVDSDSDEALPLDEKPETRVFSRDHQRTGRLEFEMTGTAGQSSGVDQAMSFRAEEIEQSMEYIMDANGVPLNFGVTTPGYDGTFDIEGARSEGILSLLAWFVAHPSQELITASQDELRGELGAAMPLWDDLSMDTTLRDLKITSPIGDFGLAEMEFMLGTSGAIADGHLQEKIRIAGLSVPEHLMPTWAGPLLPEEAALDFTFSGYDLAALASLAIDGFDLTAEDPFASLNPDQVMSATLPDGNIQAQIAPGHLKGADYAINFEGDGRFGPEQMPSGSARISATGLDKIEEALNAAPPEEAGQALMMLRMARALAQPGEGGALVWEIDASTPGGAITVNGQVMGGAPQQP
ncbi:hypothetical protein [Paracoccus methylarcula]|uniref:hypothetical protein n=1 Tax=Paracoccus methylarcula TaxID=72022 RepID=UPI001FE49B43|nr:hypothetical protein [Paracoccus methylarcula]